MRIVLPCVVTGAPGGRVDRAVPARPTQRRAEEMALLIRVELFFIKHPFRGSMYQQLVHTLNRSSGAFHAATPTNETAENTQADPAGKSLQTPE